MNIFPLSDPSNGKTIREREEIVTNVMETMRDISIVNILKACRPLGITPIFTETTFSYNMLERMTDIDKTPLFTASLYHEVEELAKKGYATQVELVPIHNRTTREYEKMLILPFMANLLNGTPVVHMTYEEVGPLLDVLSQFNHDILQQFSQELYDAARPGYIVGTVEQEDTTND